MILSQYASVPEKYNNDNFQPLTFKQNWEMYAGLEVTF